MSVGRAAKVIRAPGRLVIGPTDLTDPFPHGGTEVGKVNMVRLQPLDEPYRVVHEGTGMTGDILEDASRWVFSCFLRGWDDDAVRLLLQDGYQEGEQTQHSVFRAPGFQVAGTSALTRAVVVLYVPDDPIHVPAALIYRAVPDWANGAELQFRRSAELGMPLAFECVTDLEGRQLAVGRLADLTL